MDKAENLPRDCIGNKLSLLFNATIAFTSVSHICQYLQYILDYVFASSLSNYKSTHLDIGTLFPCNLLEGQANKV